MDLSSLDSDCCGGPGVEGRHGALTPGTGDGARTGADLTVELSRGGAGHGTGEIKRVVMAVRASA